MRKKRLEMGEEKWEEYQKKRKINKAKVWRAKNVERVVDWRRRTKERLIEYKGGKCQKCGYDKDCPSAYDFHHRDPSIKSFGISSKGITRSLEQLKIEVDKCDLLCCRCHAELHEEQYCKQRKETKLRYGAWLQAKKSEKSCVQCKNIFLPNKKKQIYCCQDCQFNSMRKQNSQNPRSGRPSKEELEKLLWEKPTAQIAKDFGVSDSAVGKWAKFYNLKKPCRGYWGFKKKD